MMRFEFCMACHIILKKSKYIMELILSLLFFWKNTCNFIKLCYSSAYDWIVSLM